MLLYIPAKAQYLNLSLNLSKGSTYYMIGNSNSTIVQTVNGQNNQINSELSYKIAFKVISLTDSIYTMEVRYQHLNMKIKIGEKTIIMDSQKGDRQDIPSSIIAAIMNKSFSITMTKSGKIRSINNVEKIIDGAFDNFPQLDAAKKLQIKNQFLQSFGGSAFKGNLEMATAIFPEVSVGKNTKWVVNTKLESTVKATVHTVYQLNNVKGLTNQIHGEATITSNKNVTGQINGLPVRYNIAGASISDIKADKVTGWVSEVKLKQIMKGDVEILDNPKVPGGMKIPMTVHTEVTTTDR